MRSLLDGAVFPLAYLVATAWVRQRGLKSLILAYKNLAIERMGYLGHSWSIWCSFLEAEPYLDNDEQALFAAERFAEFVATQLSTPDWVESLRVNFSLETESVNEQEAIDSICANPGFFGHSVITLAYLFKYRNTLSFDEWNHALLRTFHVSKKGAERGDKNTHVPKPTLAKGSVVKSTLQTQIFAFLDIAPKEAHSLTFSDALWELWDHVSEHTKQHLLEVLRIYARELSAFRRTSLT